jgi:CDP-diacylglycerol--glycerol-3-phosphate 3-phosphatidyltransferase
MTTANKVTIGRILLIPVFIVQAVYYVRTGDELYRLIAVLAFATAAISDGIDGYIARRYNQFSELGAVLDPLADKLLLLSALVLLSFDNRPWFDRLPLWLIATVFSRDAILLLGSMVIHYTCGKVRVRPRITGKIATVLLMVVVTWTLLKWNSASIFYLALATALTTIGSGVLYLVDGVRQLNASPRSASSAWPSA